MVNPSPTIVRALVRAGLLSRAGGFSFPDRVVLETAANLVAEGIPLARVRRALQRLKERLPADSPLSAVQVEADGRTVVVRDGAHPFEPDTGQGRFDFTPPARARRTDTGRTARDWFTRGCALETTDPDSAAEAYEQALELDPEHADAHTNLGRLRHEGGDLPGAEEHYRLALETAPDDATVWFNLGVALEDLGRGSEAVQAYERALELAPAMTDAAFNLANLLEALGRRVDAFQKLSALSRSRSHASCSLPLASGTGCAFGAQSRGGLRG